MNPIISVISKRFSDVETDFGLLRPCYCKLKNHTSNNQGIFTNNPNYFDAYLKLRSVLEEASNPLVGMLNPTQNSRNLNKSDDTYKNKKIEENICIASKQESIKRKPAKDWQWSK